MRSAETVLGIIRERGKRGLPQSRSGYASWHPGGAKPSWSADAVTRPSTQDGHYDSEHRHKSLESGVMRKYHAPFGGRPTEKGSIKSTSPAAHPTLALMVILQTTAKGH